MNDQQARLKLEEIAADTLRVVKPHLPLRRKSTGNRPANRIVRDFRGWATPDIFDPAFRDALTKLHSAGPSAGTSFGWHLDRNLSGYARDKPMRRRKDVRAYRMLTEP